MSGSKLPGHWRVLRKGTSYPYVDYGLTGGTTLLATDVQVKIGPEIEIEFDLGKNLRTRNTEENTYMYAMDLADGEINVLKSLVWRDTTGLKRLGKILRGVDVDGVS